MSQPPRALSPAILGAIAASALGLSFVVFRAHGGSGDTREWQPSDHDQPAGAQNAQNAPGKPRQAPKQPQAAQQGGENLVELAWSRSCTPCHGPMGRGDGPQGPMMRAPDLTRADWQARVTDDEIAKTIREGRNKMPRFDLPPEVVNGLVKRIRAARAKGD
jgi:cytochrome c oxidase cbb3-type subunit 3